MNYAIIGGGCFGLYCAKYILQYDNTANITIYDNNIDLSSTINGGNGMFHKPFKPKAKIMDIISFQEKNMYTTPIYFHSIKPGWAFFSGINTMFNNSINRKLISDITEKTDNYCEDGSDFKYVNYWESLLEELKNKNVKIINEYVKKYETINNKIIINNNIYDKIIIATNNNFNLIKTNKYNKLFENISGLSIILKVKNMPKCFYFDDFMFVTPYGENMVNVTTHLEIGYNKGNYIITDNTEIENIILYLKKNKAIMKLEIIEVMRIWRGVRAVTYDMLPFFTELEKNVYWITGGSYLGTNSSKAHCRWLIEHIYKKNYTDIPKNYDPTINRLLNIRKKYLMITIMILFIIMVIIIFRDFL